MSNTADTFFTSVGCMDGRVQKLVADYGRSIFHAEYPDTITEPGFVGLLVKYPPKSDITDVLMNKLLISLDKHHSAGIVVHGHEDCAGNPVSQEQHIEEIKKSVDIIKNLVAREIVVKGVYVKVDPLNVIEIV